MVKATESGQSGRNWSKLPKLVKATGVVSARRQPAPSRSRKGSGEGGCGQRWSKRENMVSAGESGQSQRNWSKRGEGAQKRRKWSKRPGRVKAAESGQSGRTTAKSGQTAGQGGRLADPPDARCAAPTSDAEASGSRHLRSGQSVQSGQSDRKWSKWPKVVKAAESG